jgi:hypothetical protein
MVVETEPRPDRRRYIVRSLILVRGEVLRGKPAELITMPHLQSNWPVEILKHFRTSPWLLLLAVEQPVERPPEKGETRGHGL